MKKLLKSILIATASVGMIAGSVTAVVSCGSNGGDTPNPGKEKLAQLLKEDADKMEAKLKTYTTASPLVIDSKMADGITTGGYTSSSLITDITKLLAGTPKDYPNTSLAQLVVGLATGSTFANVNTTMTTAVNVNLTITLKSKSDATVTQTIASVPVGVKVTFHNVTDDVNALKNKISGLIPTDGIPLSAMTGTQLDTEYLQILNFIILGLYGVGIINIADYPSLSDHQFQTDVTEAKKGLPDPSATPPVAPTKDQEDAAKKLIKANILNIHDIDANKDFDISGQTPGKSFNISITINDIHSTVGDTQVTNLTITTKAKI